MKNIILSIVLGFSILLIASCEQETTTEKLQDQSNDLQREATKKMHRIEEAACTGSDMECLAKKAKNRAQEASKAIKDKATELKNKIDG
jgi:gas vesicle protein